MTGSHEHAGGDLPPDRADMPRGGSGEARRDRPTHLLNRPEWLPGQRRGTTPQMIGRYPEYDVLEQADHWDPVTRRVVLDRVRPPGPLRFFGPDEEPALRTLCDTCLAQDHEPRVPVAEYVDQTMADGRLDGYQYADMPDDRDTWRIVLAGLDETARERYGTDFAGCGLAEREEIVKDFSAGALDGGSWDRLNVTRAWSVCMRAMLTGFYSHPWAWNEIGFGGPAYPRGFMRTGPTGVREPHETPGATREDAAAEVAAHPEEFGE